ncbi:MAG TPA: TIGR03118 family protein [Bryobacteraceae bacterium]|nr:TIGR03118 family protein [Bryobacteraceae bacterium]
MIKFPTNQVNRAQIGRTWVPALRCATVLLCFLGVSLFGADAYLVHNLVSDLPNMADHMDPNLVNPWGNGFSATSPFWIGNNGSGTSTLYNTSGTAVALVVSIPPPAGAAASATGAVTGVLFNSASPSFNVASGKPASFIFCTEDGTISGWNSSVDKTHAIIMADNSKSGAVYKGCALGAVGTSAMLYAANFNAGTIDVWDGSLSPVTNSGAFANAAIPAGFAPFNIQNIGGTLYVTYAKQDSAKHDDVAGVGNGYVATFDTTGKLLANVVSAGVLNSPWGMAMAPATFGDFSGALLVANFGDGLIHAYNATNGSLMGTLTDPSSNAIAIPGMWSINFGNGGSGGDKSTLYFAAGIAGPNGEPVESHGLFGSIQPAPTFTTAGIQNGASFSSASAIAPNTFVTIKGGALSETTRPWATTDFNGTALPTKLDNVSVTVNGEPAYVAYISPSQINFLAPADLAPGPVQVQVTNNGLTSAMVAGTALSSAPAFFTIGATNSAGNSYIAATHADGSIAGPPSLITGATTTPFSPGEIAILYGNGFAGTTSPVPNGQIISTALQLAVTPVVMIGGVPAAVQFAGLSATGEFQFNVVVPSTLTLSGTGPVDVPVVIQSGGAQTQSNAVISVAVPAT